MFAFPLVDEVKTTSSAAPRQLNNGVGSNGTLT
jgi:hypothetical protein